MEIFTNKILVSKGNQVQACEWLAENGYDRPNFERRLDHLEW